MPPDSATVTSSQLLDQLFYGLASSRKWSTRRIMEEAMRHVAKRTGYSESTVYRWRQNKLRPSAAALKTLIRIGKEECGLPREWAEELLGKYEHPSPRDEVLSLWGEREVRVVPNNLPTPMHASFVGRRDELARLLRLLSPMSGVHPISVSGIGGVGKTALALEAAYRCLRSSTGEAVTQGVPIFDAIIFVSAKRRMLSPYGILERRQCQSTLEDVCRVIARTMDTSRVPLLSSESQFAIAKDVLIRQPTLLIIDNMETLVDKQGVLDFLFDLPHQVKVLITTREELWYSALRLEPLPEQDCLDLIGREADEKSTTISEDGAQLLSRATGGIPAAIVYSVGQLASGCMLDSILGRLASHDGEIAKFCFEESVTPLRCGTAHRLLLALTMFPGRPTLAAVAHVAGLADEDSAVERVLERLQQLSLVKLREGRISILPLTREYAMLELAPFSDFEIEARERWIAWYLGLAKTYGGDEWSEWYTHYDRIGEEWENLLAVFEWCAERERYDEIKAFWVDNRIERFAGLYGHWDERLVWSDWLCEAAERRGDWRTALLTRRYKSWALMWKGRPRQLQEADELLSRAWELRKYEAPANLPGLADDCAVLAFRRKDYSLALDWLAKEQQLVDDAALVEPARSRFLAWALYLRGRIHLELGEAQEAEEAFALMLEKAESIRWQRAAIYAQLGLADAAVKLGKLDVARNLLREGLPVAERNKDRRCTASYQKALGNLAGERGQHAEALAWARKAKTNFDRLGIYPESAELDLLIAEEEERIKD